MLVHALQLLECLSHGAVVERAGMSGQFDIDSCGTGGGSSNWYLPGGFRQARQCHDACQELRSACPGLAGA